MISIISQLRVLHNWRSQFWQRLLPIGVSELRSARERQDRSRTIAFDSSDNIHSRANISKHSVLAIEVRCRCGTDEELHGGQGSQSQDSNEEMIHWSYLRPIGIFSSIGHGEDARTSVSEKCHGGRRKRSE